MQKKLNRRNLNRKQSEDNSSKPEVQLKDSAQQINGATNQKENSAGQATDEAIDVLNFMRFKL